MCQSYASKLEKQSELRNKNDTYIKLLQTA